MANPGTAQLVVALRDGGTFGSGGQRGDIVFSQNLRVVAVSLMAGGRAIGDFVQRDEWTITSRDGEPFASYMGRVTARSTQSWETLGVLVANRTYVLLSTVAPPVPPQATHL